MAVKRIAHPSFLERQARGRDAGDRTPPSSHSGWLPAVGRPDPVALLEEQNVTREPDLVPVRHGRMMVSPFTFYRGAAKIMAADLKDTPTAGLVTQLCGDAHLSNFGVFASPERRLLFDLNDFDETLPGPFEYDVKRMAASFTIAGRNNGFSTADSRASTLASVRAYREAMTEFAAMRTMDVWYFYLSEDDFMDAVRGSGPPEKASAKKSKGKREAREVKQAKAVEKTVEKAAVKARTRTACRRFPSSESWSTGGIGSSASRRSSSRRASWPRPTAWPPRRLTARSASSCASTGRRCRTIAATC